MVFPVTVIGSAVVCLFFVSLGCANANGALSKQARRILVSFMIPPFLLSKLRERVWLAQGPLPVLATVQFHLAPAEPPSQQAASSPVNFSILRGALALDR